MFTSNLLRRSVRLGGIIATTAVMSAVADYNAPFDTMGFATTIVPKDMSPNAVELALAGAGMRRKNLYIVEVDVYKIGYYLSSEALKKAQDSVSKGGRASDIIVDDANVAKAKQPWISVPCNFVRTVSTNQIVEAFNDAFVGCNQQAVAEFKEVLRATIGDNGVKAGEEVRYYFVKGGGVIITKDGKVGGIVHFNEVEKRLLDVYVEPKASVSPQLVQCIEKNFQSLKF